MCRTNRSRRCSVAVHSAATLFSHDAWSCGSRRLLTLWIAGYLGVLGATVCAGDDWPQFRGPNSRGVSLEPAPLPVEFSPTQNVTWQQQVGDGVGGAVVADGRVFVSGMTDDQTVSLFAFDLDSGVRLWQRDWPTGELPEIHATNSHASTTPAADADRVYFYFSTLGLIALDARSGEDVWQETLPTPFFVF